MQPLRQRSTYNTIIADPGSPYIHTFQCLISSCLQPVFFLQVSPLYFTSTPPNKDGDRAILLLSPRLTRRLHEHHRGSKKCLAESHKFFPDSSHAHVVATVVHYVWSFNFSQNLRNGYSCRAGSNARATVHLSNQKPNQLPNLLNG